MPSAPRFVRRFLPEDASPLEAGLARFFCWVYGLRAAVLLGRAFLPLGLPEVWRQTDTLGIALRYWTRFLHPAGPTAPWWAPALLQSGDAVGVNATEFPLLALLHWPWFNLGPWWGQHLAVASHVLLVLGLGLLNARVWRDQRIQGLAMGPAMLLLPLFSLSMGWAGKFTPDLLSVTLACLALGLSWEGKRRPLALLPAALAVLLKPTTVCVYALVLLKDGAKRWRRDAAWLALALLPAALYYTLGVEAIRSHQDIPTYFRIEKPDFWLNFREYFAQPKPIFKFLLTRLFSPYLPLVLLLGWPAFRRALSLPRVLVIFGLQWLLVILLSGSYLFSHDYYQMGLAPLALIVFWAWLCWTPQPWLRRLALALWLVHLGELSATDLAALKPGASVPLERQAQRLVLAHPEAPWGQGLPFRSSLQPYPELGLAFGERQNSTTAKWGFFYAKDPVPAGCAELGREGELVLVRCD